MKAAIIAAVMGAALGFFIHSMQVSAQTAGPAPALGTVYCEIKTDPSWDGPGVVASFEPTP